MPPPHHAHPFFNIIKAQRGLGRVPPKTEQNAHRCRASPPKRKRVPWKSPASPPASPPASAPPHHPWGCCHPANSAWRQLESRQAESFKKAASGTCRRRPCSPADRAGGRARWRPGTWTGERRERAAGDRAGVGGAGLHPPRLNTLQTSGDFRTCLLQTGAKVLHKFEIDGQ